MGRELHKGMLSGGKSTFCKQGQYLKTVPKGIENIKVINNTGDIFYAKDFTKEEMLSSLKEIDIINPQFITNIIGRPIRLADVLGTVYPDEITNTHLAIVARWNLKQDDLTLQSQETIDFLYSLLNKEE